MTKIKWKGPYVCEPNLKQFKKLEKNYNSTIINRNNVILPKFIEKTFKIHNGQKYFELYVNEKMLGHKFGEFSYTRKRFIYKKKQKK